MRERERKREKEERRKIYSGKRREKGEEKGKKEEDLDRELLEGETDREKSWVKDSEEEKGRSKRKKRVGGGERKGG